MKHQNKQEHHGHLDSHHEHPAHVHHHKDEHRHKHNGHSSNPLSFFRQGIAHAFGIRKK